MTGPPDVSVVMGVFNGGVALSESIESVIAQETVRFELIIVNDGSTDQTRELIETYASRDNRLRIINTPNEGLTKALVLGCAHANGRYIARQDSGDISLLGRLAMQVSILNSDPEAVLVSCGTQFLGPEDEKLHQITQTTESLTSGLSKLQLDQLRGPSHHGSTMFRRDAYERAGGYRSEFRVAQDLDLWLRLFELGSCLAIPDVLYAARLIPGSISSTKRDQQIATAQVILNCAAARREGRSDAALLKGWQNTVPVLSNAGRAGQEIARFNCHLGGLLRKIDPLRSRHYYLKSIRSSLLYAPAWAGLIRLIASR